MRWLLALYPRAWRRRYGEEFLAVLDGMQPSPALVLDCLRGALDAHLHRRVSGQAAADRSVFARPPETMPESDRPGAAPAGQRPATPSGSRGEVRCFPWPMAGDEQAGWETVIDRIVRDGQARGAFDNLPGAGRPLNLADRPPVSAWEPALRVARQAGDRPPWIGLVREIDAGEEQIRALAHVRSSTA